MRPEESSPYHQGEQLLQTLAGVRERTEQQGRRMIHDFMPEPHRALFAELPFLWVGSLDAEGRPWASVLTGAPGFVRTPSPRQVFIAARPTPHDPLARAIARGAPLGLLGIQLHTRRRSRVNGRVELVAAGGFGLRVDQSFGNCPQYIAARAPEHALEPARDVRASLESAVLGAEARACIEAADTCFIASASSARPAPGDPREGVDVSHRGGKSGFVRVRDAGGASVLSLPDFAGNNAFNTLGNVLRHPFAGLAFPSFDSGTLLLVTGDATLDLEGPDVARFEGARRLLHLRVHAGVLLHDALPRAWSPAQPAAQVARTGSWSSST